MSVRLPAAGIARLVQNLERLTTAAHGAVAAAPPGPEQARWTHAGTLLLRETGLLRAAAQQAAAGDPAPLLRQAGALRFLARRMDGYRMDFAGEDWARTLTAARRLLVLSAWQIHAAGSGSGASGL